MQINSTQHRLLAMRAEEHGLSFVALRIFTTLVWPTNRGLPALRKAVNRCTQPKHQTMLIDKTLLWLLTSYMLLQLGALFLGVGLFFILYLIVYLVAIIYAAIQISKAVRQQANLKPLMPSLALFFLANLILFLIYVPTLLYNPNINWTLKGEVEQDPMILQAYVPPIFFCISLIGLLLTALFTKFISGAKTGMRTT